MTILVCHKTVFFKSSKFVFYGTVVTMALFILSRTHVYSLHVYNMKDQVAITVEVKLMYYYTHT